MPWKWCHDDAETSALNFNIRLLVIIVIIIIIIIAIITILIIAECGYLMSQLRKIRFSYTKKKIIPCLNTQGFLSLRKLATPQCNRKTIFLKGLADRVWHVLPGCFFVRIQYSTICFGNVSERTLDTWQNFLLAFGIIYRCVIFDQTILSSGSHVKLTFARQSRVPISFLTSVEKKYIW